jgi:hypothetical protein
MSEKSMRRRTVLTTGTVAVSTLAGCASLLEGEGETNTDTPETEEPPQEPETPEQPVNETEEEETEEDPNQDQEQASNYTWEDILESEQEFYEENLEDLKKVVIRAKRKDKVGEDFKYTPESEIFDDVAGGVGYTHGGKYFDVDHFKDADFEDALRDARTIVDMKATEINDGNLNISGMTAGLGWTIEELFEEIRDQELRMGDFGSEGHGFWPIVISPGKDPYTLDSTNDYIGKTWEDPMSQRSGKSPIVHFSEERLRDSLFTAEYQKMLRGLSDQSGGYGETFVNKSLLIDANKHFSTEDIPYDKMVPAIAVLNYQEAEFEPDKYHMLHADEWEKLPSFKPGEDDFQEYRNQIEKHIHTFEDNEEGEKYFFAKENWEE